VPDDPTAIDDEFTVAPDAGPTHLSVLTNDANVDSPSRQASQLSITSIDRISYVDLVADTLVAPGKAAVVPSLIASDTSIGSVWRPGGDFVLRNPFVPTDWLPTGLTLTAVGPTDHGGTVEIGENGLDVVYTPAAGFEGIETFSYTVTNEAGRSATATVTVRVGTAPTSALAPTIDASSLSAVAEPARDVATQIAFSLPATTSPSESLRAGMSAGLLSAAIDSTASLRQTALNLLSQQLFNSPAERHGFAATDSAIAELTSSDGENRFASVGNLLDDLAFSLVASPAGADQLSF
jgi:Big-like domain-containing protein